jgi:hypothetical protein
MWGENVETKWKGDELSPYTASHQNPNPMAKEGERE